MAQSESLQDKDKVASRESWLRYGVPTFVSLVLGVSTFWIDHRISERAEQEQAARLYTQLISDREQAASGLRKDMFATILGGFLESESANNAAVGSKLLEKDLLKLELLALNFGDALSLSPLFSMMDRKIRTPGSYVSNVERLDRERLDSRLESLARRVADSQRGSLASESASFEVKIPRNKVGEVGSFSWPETERDEQFSCLVLGRIQRWVQVTFENVNKEAKTIDVSLSISSHKLAANAPTMCAGDFEDCAPLPAKCSEFVTTHYAPPPSKPFTIDRFNLPLIDNSLLSDDQRFALVMRDFTPEHVEVVGILYPGKFAGRRDKLTLDQAIDSLKGRLK